MTVSWTGELGWTGRPGQGLGRVTGLDGIRETAGRWLGRRLGRTALAGLAGLSGAEAEPFAHGRRKIRERLPRSARRAASPGGRPAAPSTAASCGVGEQAQEPVGERRPRGRGGHPEHPQPGHPAVGVDVEADVLGDRPAGDGETVAGVGLERGAGQQVPAVVAAATPSRARCP